jgi:hypothetical protein
MCLFPKLIENRKYKANKKNGGIIPPVSDKRTLMVPVGCGKCIECKKQKARNWQVRLHEEIRHDKKGKFVTLTFSDESIKELSKEITGVTGYNLDNEIATLGVRRYLERWRKKYKKSVKHWFITELGGKGTENIHIHGIMWTDEIEDISKIWKYGIVTIGERRYKNGIKQNDKSLGYVNEKTINYIIKYVNKPDEKHTEYNSKVLTSAGIGKKYLDRIDSKQNKYNGNKTIETYKTRQGIQLNMPIYYRNHIYTEEEREKLWLQKLDKEERWVCGEKIDISKNEDDYYKTREYYRQKNKRLGYGDNEITEEKLEKKRYEINTRKIKMWTRIQRANNKIADANILKNKD